MMDITIHNFSYTGYNNLIGTSHDIPLTEPKKVKFAFMKLTGQASQYLINVKSMRASWRQGQQKLGLYEGQT